MKRKSHYSNYGYKSPKEGESATNRPEYTHILEMVKPGSRVLDAGCGDGSLGALLMREKGCRVFGLEIDKNGASHARKKGVDVRICDVDEGLPFANDSFDYAIMNVTLQMVYLPKFVLEELKRVSRRQIVSFPNFAHLPARLEMLFLGRMPKTALFGHEWHSTRHIHHLSYNDFLGLAKQEGLKVLKVHKLNLHSRNTDALSAAIPSLFCGTAIFLLEK